MADTPVAPKEGPETAPAKRMQILQRLKQAGPKPAVKKPAPLADDDANNDETTIVKPQVASGAY